MDIEATDIVVTGRVQGVFFRAAMREQADRLGVTGWVRNEPDGTVPAHLEGSAQRRLPTARWCAEGPPRLGWTTCAPAAPEVMGRETV